MIINEATLYSISQEIKSRDEIKKIQEYEKPYINYEHLRIEDGDEWIMLAVNQSHYPFISIVPVDWNLRKKLKIETNKCRINKIDEECFSIYKLFIRLTFNAIEISEQEI